MKVIFFGTSEFAKMILQEILKKKVRPLLVVTQPNSVKGRGWKLYPAAVKIFAEENSLNCITPAHLEEEGVRDILKNLCPDLFLVTDYGKRIPRQILSIPRIMPLGLHPSLLPMYRGAAPIRWVLLKGEVQTGVTLFKMEEKFDTGPILLQKKITIEENDDYFTLSAKLAVLGAQCFLEGMERIRKGDYSLSIQDERQRIFAPKLEKEDGRIDWRLPPSSLKNLVRAFKGWPFAYTFYKGRRIIVLEVEVVSERMSSFPCGSIVKIDKTGIYVSSGGGIVKIKKVKPESKKEMDGYAFVCGYRVKVGDKFE